MIVLAIAVYLTPGHTGASWIDGAFTLAVCVAMWALVALASRGASGEDEDGEDQGGGGGGGTVPTPPRGSDGSPAWWPEFERQFAAWVERSPRHEPVVTGRRG